MTIYCINTHTLNLLPLEDELGGVQLEAPAVDLNLRAAEQLVS